MCTAPVCIFDAHGSSLALTTITPSRCCLVYITQPASSLLRPYTQIYPLCIPSALQIVVKLSGDAIDECSKK